MFWKPYEWYETESGEIEREDHITSLEYWVSVVYNVVVSGAFWALFLFLAYNVQKYCQHISLFQSFFSDDPTINSIPEATYGQVLCTYLYICLIFAVCFFLYACRMTRHMLHLRALSHRFHHRARDAYFNALNYPGGTLKSKKNTYTNFSVEICTSLQKLWKEVFNGGGGRIGVCIRLATKDMEYKTYGRSPNLSQERIDKSSPVKIDEGVVKIICENPRGRVLLIKNIKNAHKYKINGISLWKKTETDHLGDVRSVLIAPINCYEQTKKGHVHKTCGLLYITSSRSCIFSPFGKRHVQLLCAIADSLGCLYPHLSHLINPRP